MARKNKNVDLIAPQDPDLEERLRKAIFDRTETGVPIIELKEHFRTFKNIIDFITSPEGLDMPSLWDFTRQYEKIRDFYILMCPWCNIPGPNPLAPFDCWGKSPTQLQEDILFEKDENGVYVCPKCHKKQREMGIPLPNTMLGICGMRCLSGNTWILSQDGLVQMKHAPKTAWNRSGIQKINAFLPQGERPTLDLKIKWGFSIRCATNHPILIHQGRVVYPNNREGRKSKPPAFIQADQLHIGNKVVIPINQQVFGERKIDLPLSSFTGLIVGDGCISGKKPYNYVYKISGSDEDVLQFLVNFHKGSLSRQKNKWSFEFSDCKLYSEFEKLGYNREWKAPTKEIPSAILKSCRETVVAFLKGLFEADGCASTDCVNYTTVSHTLAKQVHLLLLNFGVVSCLSNSPSRKFASKEPTGETSYTIKIKEREALKRFAEKIGFLCPTKTRRLQKILLRPPVKIKRTCIHRAPWGEYILAFVKCISPGPTEPLYDFCMDGNDPSFYSDGFISHNSGKTMMAAQIALWELHQDLLLPNPQKDWGLAPNQQVYYTLCTTKSEQATDTIFAAVDGIHDHSPWFKRYHEALRERAKEEKVPFDKVYTKSITAIKYFHKQLFVDNTGANSAGIAGKTRKLVVMDEIARFVQTESRMGVDAVYDTLHQSLLTLSDHGSKMLNISSTMFKTDKIMMLYDAEQKNPSPRTLCFKNPTWDFNPKWPHDHPFFEDMRHHSPLALRRDFGCDPPGAQDPWMEEEWRIDECVDADIPALIHVQDYQTSLTVRQSDGTWKQTDMVSKRVLFKHLTATKRIVISCDPGHRRDSFGMILAYVKSIRTVQGMQDHMFVGYAMAWEPSLNPRREVDFKNVVDLIKEFSKHWIVENVVYDSWQSIFQIQDLKGAGINAERISLVKDDWESLAALFYNRQIHLLHDKIGGKGSERLTFELKNLQLTPGGKVDHQVNTTSDIAVCLARAAKVLMGPEAEQHKIWDMRSRDIGRAVRFARP